MLSCVQPYVFVIFFFLLFLRVEIYLRDRWIGAQKCISNIRVNWYNTFRPIIKIAVLTFWQIRTQQTWFKRLFLLSISQLIYHFIYFLLRVTTLYQWALLILMWLPKIHLSIINTWAIPLQVCNMLISLLLILLVNQTLFRQINLVKFWTEIFEIWSKLFLI